MYNLILVTLFILSISSCQTPQAETSTKVVETNAKPSVHKTKTKLIPKPSPKNKKTVEVDELIETFSNETEIGNPKKNKIELSYFGNSIEGSVKINFYSLSQNKKWKLKQTLEIEKDGHLPLSPEFEDFNNDDFKDITFVSGITGRGANDMRKLLLYDKKNDELIHITNSDDYPNLGYNERLDCISALRVYGGHTTEFLKFNGNKLEKFASVETMGAVRKVYLVDKNGKRKLVREDKVNPHDGFMKYETFDPPS